MDLVRAAVLVPVSFDRRGRPELTFIVRAERLDRHAGQVAFPGGRYEPEQDESLLAAALRESEEEVGLCPRDVRVLGALPECRTLSSRYLISPFVGEIPEQYPFRPDPAEVAGLLTAPLDAFREQRQPFVWERADQRIQTLGMRLGEHVVWGATLRIIDELLRIQGDLLLGP